MADAMGFWSYVHADDDAEGGRICRIAADLTAQYEAITAESIKIFVDRSDIEWGDTWRGSVESALASIAFFIPVITPRYFKSAECRREFNTFARRAGQLGVRELVMPILYIDFPALHADPPVDELMALAKSFQWEPWTTLRFAEPNSREYRESVAKMAERLMHASLLAETVNAVPIVDQEDEDDSPGFADRVASAEQAMMDWAGTLTGLEAPILEVGQAVADAAGQIGKSDAAGAGMAGRLEAYRKLSEDLNRPAEQIQTLSNAFAVQMNDVDLGMQALFEQADKELQDASDPELPEKFQEFAGQIRDLAASAKTGLGSLGVMVDSIGSVENQSRNLRPVLRKLRRSFTVLMDGQEVINSWGSSADEILKKNDL